MTRDDLRRAAELLPPGAALLLPREALLAALNDGSSTASLDGIPNEAPAQEECWLTAEEVAVKLNVTPRWCYDHAAQLGAKRLTRRCVRFSSLAVAKYMKRHHT
jgi:hypothetical protein